MNSTVLNIRIDPKIKKEASELAQTLGLSLSALVNGSLRTFIRTKKIEFSTSTELTKLRKDVITEAEKYQNRK